RGEPVWPLVIDEAEQQDRDPRLIALMRARDAQGRAKYGVPLCANDGRDTSLDAIQEALDLMVYLRKRQAEGCAIRHYLLRTRRRPPSRPSAPRMMKTLGDSR
ncbi:MAG: hypothetical protein ACRCU1_19010, partial [Alsobacter sp.]